MTHPAEILIPYQCSGCGHYGLAEMENGKVTCLWCKTTQMII
jgi:hypothetical protein